MGTPFTSGRTIDTGYTLNSDGSVTITNGGRHRITCLFNYFNTSGSASTSNIQGEFLTSSDSGTTYTEVDSFYPFDINTDIPNGKNIVNSYTFIFDANGGDRYTLRWRGNNVAIIVNTRLNIVNL